MKQNERSEAIKAGYTLLKAQWDNRVGQWKIMKMGVMFVWSRFGAGWYWSRGVAEEKIDMIIDHNPSMKYRKDNCD